jgi:hypothetical protein
MNKFALDTVLETVGYKMDALEDVFKSPQAELLEESLLKIKWKLERDVLGSSLLTIKAVLSAETFMSEMSSGMFQLIAQSRIKRLRSTDFIKSNTK